MIDIIDKKQMHNSVIMGKEYASKDWTCVISMFLTSFNVYFVFGCACFMCVCLKTAIWVFLAFLGQGLAFFVKTGWQPCCVVQQDSILQAGVCASQSSRTPMLNCSYSRKHQRSLILQLSIALTQWWVCFTPLLNTQPKCGSYELLCRNTEFIFLRYPDLERW